MSALRSFGKLASSSSRLLVQRGVASSSRSTALLTAARSALAQNTRIAAISSRAFSASACARGEGACDLSLAQKLGEELAYEKEAATAGPPDFVKEFQSQGVWTIKDTSGADEVALTRTFGNETIRIMFSIADLDAEPEADFENEGEGEDAAPASDSISSVPIRVSISVTKSGAEGALNVDAACQDGAFLVENVSFYPDSKTGTELTAESDWKRRGLYLGPTFENLDPAVQDEFEKYLDERGINESVALFIPDYAEYKEQVEYVRWLEGMKKFVEA